MNCQIGEKIRVHKTIEKLITLLNKALNKKLEVVSLYDFILKFI